MSDPPPTHQPWTRAIVGFGLDHNPMKFGTGPSQGFVTPIMSRPGAQAGRCAFRAALSPLRAEIEARAEAPPRSP